MKKYIILLFISLISCHRYHTFNNEINSIYGTGDTKYDIEYRVECDRKCNKCCDGQIKEKIRCLEEDECDKIENKLYRHIYKILLGVYFMVLVITTIIVFLVFYFISKKVYSYQESIKNGRVMALLVLSSGLILPIIILKIISCYKKIPMIKLLGGNFEKITPKIVLSVETKLSEREKKYLIEEEIKPETDPAIKNDFNK